MSWGCGPWFVHGVEVPLEQAVEDHRTRSREVVGRYLALRSSRASRLPRSSEGWSREEWEEWEREILELHLRQEDGRR